MPEVIINGPEGRLEARYMPAIDPTAPIALILHPEPNYGGNMNNRVSFAMYKLFQARGFSVMRFNFRGVGRSQGNYSGGEGELSDAATALDWIQSQCSGARSCWIAGFSFGALIGMQLMMRRPEVVGFVSITLPVHEHDFTFLAPCPSSGLVVHGGADQVVSSEQVTSTIEKIPTQKGIKIDFREIEDANHFFTHHLDDLTDTIGDYLSTVEPDMVEQTDD
jgi:alpha/beta superfamily hydrolase